MDRSKTKTFSEEINEFCNGIDLSMRKLSSLVVEQSISKDPQKLKQIEQIVVQENAIEYYNKKLKSLFTIPPTTIDLLKQKHEKEVQQIEDLLKKEKDSLDVYQKRNILLKKAKMIAFYGEKSKAEQILKNEMEMSPNANIRLEVIFEILKVFIFFDDFVAFDEYVQIAVPLEKESIDWEKRNQLKVYKALNYSEKGEFRKAAKLFVSSLSTFASEDILPFSDIILMASAFSFISLDRLSLKSQIIDSPEVVSGLADLPSLDLLLKSVYELKYSDFYTALGKLKPIFETNRFLRRHFESFENSAKRVIYGQFLESYVSVTVSSIAESFNVSVEQIYKDFFVYISNGEIEAKVDRQEEVIHRYVKDQQAEAFYKIAEAGQHLSQKAQLLLNKIQNKS